MKILNIYTSIMLLAVLVSSCKKENDFVTPSSSITVANTAVGSPVLNFNGLATVLGSNAAVTFPFKVGAGTVILTDPLATAGSTFFSQPVSPENGERLSLFLTGSISSTVESVLIKENYQNYTDSLCGVRLINLSPNSTPISVNLTGSENGSEVTSLAYKSYSEFKQYPAKKLNPRYVFQIKNATTGALITSYTLTTPYFHNVTIVLRGMPGSNGVTLVAHP